MKGSITLKLMILFNILLIISISAIFVYKAKGEEKKETPPQQTLGVEEIPKEEKDISVSVCDTEIKNCIWLTSDGLIKEDIVDENAVYQKVLDTVLPYIETQYGGKTIASNRNGNFIYWKEDMIPDLSNIFTDVYNAFKSGEDTQILIQTKDLPGTDGRYSNKYIEIDNSKQKLYVWIDGKVVKEILLSGPKVGYEVYGVFPIIDKGISPIAPTGRYMPYWMAFYYSKRQDSWYGLHALIWWYDENGKKVYEPTTNIGVRRSGGCIRMLYEDSKYLYEIFEKGDHILIHE